MTSPSKEQEEQERQIALEANEVIESAKKCVATGEGMLRHKTHVFLDHGRKCQCGDVNLDRYSRWLSETL